MDPAFIKVEVSTFEARVGGRARSSAVRAWLLLHGAEMGLQAYVQLFSRLDRERVTDTVHERIVHANFFVKVVCFGYSDFYSLDKS
jgi:hypothetical protein